MDIIKFNDRGFSLIDVLIGIFILGLIVTFASYALLQSSPRYQLRRSTWAIQVKLIQARYLAIFKNIPHRCVFKKTGIVLEKKDSASQKWIAISYQELPGVVVEANNTPTFYPQGTVSNLASILVYNANGSFKITIAISGRIKTVPAPPGP